MKTQAILLSIFFGFLFSISPAQVGKEMKSKMLCSALNNSSTSPNYVVVIVKNKNTGISKEICTEAPFLEGAVEKETGCSSIDCKSYKTRNFAFSNKNALLNISFDSYNQADLTEFAATIDLVAIVEKVKKGKLKTMTFKNNDNVKTQIMFAHLMFNNGIMMTRGCIAGNICELNYLVAK